MPVLVCKRIVFYSQNDEASFFRWARLIKCVSKIEGIGSTVRLHVRGRVTNEDLRDLLALFCRYKVGMEQLRQFKTERNEEWFCNVKAYWYSRVFRGSAPLQP